MSVATSVAVIGGAAIAAGGAIAASSIGASAADDASTAAERGQREAMAAQERMAREGIAYQERQANSSLDFLKQQYQDAQNQLRPYSDIQLGATRQLEGFQDANNPIYQQQRDRMTQAIQQQLAAQGLLRSGRQTAELTDLELGLNQQRLGVSQGLAGLGASQGLAGLAQGYGGQVAGIQNNLGAGVGSAFGAMGGQQAQSATNLAQLQQQKIMGDAQRNAGLVTGLTNIAGNTLGAFGQQNQNFMTNALLAKSLGVKDAQGLADLKKMFGGW